MRPIQIQTLSVVVNVGGVGEEFFLSGCFILRLVGIRFFLVKAAGGHMNFQFEDRIFSESEKEEPQRPAMLTHPP